MPLVTPTPIPAYPPAPQPTDDRVTFSTKSFALAGSYEPQRIIFNTVAGEVYTNALWSQTKAGDSAASAAQAATSAGAAASAVVAVNQTVADILAAKDAIQAGPVASVMGKTGVVTGLVLKDGPQYGPPSLMADAPLGQWAQYGTVGGTPGADWPTTATTAWWNVFTIGVAGRKTQRASQVFSGPQQGWVFERQLHDSTWSRWQRVFTDGALIEGNKYWGTPGTVYSIDPSIASANAIDVYSAITVNVANPRGVGDQASILFSMTGAYPITFSSNVKPPDGGVPTFAANRFWSVALIARPDNNWALHIGGANPW